MSSVLSSTNRCKGESAALEPCTADSEKAPRNPNRWQ